jgi:UDPglucose--hexose-1-phosphate uridylyltransferase
LRDGTGRGERGSGTSVGAADAKRGAGLSTSAVSQTPARPRQPGRRARARARATAEGAPRTRLASAVPDCVLNLEVSGGSGWAAGRSVVEIRTGNSSIVTWEQRWHPLREEWVVIAAHRDDRPWSGQTVVSAQQSVPAYVPDCYLCPGNPRVSGVRNQAYDSVFVFDNDLPCVGTAAPRPAEPPAEIYRARAAQGLARVVCCSPAHNVTLAELGVDCIVELLETWQQQYLELGARPEVRHVLVFENKGEVVGMSYPHPHGQIYATNFVFKTMELELGAEARHYRQTGRILFQDILLAERQDGRRVVAEKDSAIAFLPYFARYSYETYVAPKSTHASLAALSPLQLQDLADVLKQLLVRFDNLWQMSFPYVMVLHQAPTDGQDYGAHHFHIQFHPPLRSPKLLKYLGGPEVGGGCFVTDSAPQAKAAELLAVPSVHYRQAPA